MKQHLDNINDYILYGTVFVCFIAAMLFITKATLMTMQGWNGVREQIIDAGLLMGIGIALSSFVFWIKTWSGK